VKRILTRLSLGLLVAVLLLGAAEGVLRLVQPDLSELRSPLVYQQSFGAAWTAGKTAGSRIYVSGRRRVVRAKPAGQRVLVFGASAAYGEMFTEFAAFPGQAQRVLRAAAPDQVVEVLNLAHGGMGSRQVGEMILRAVSHEKPDLIVVYSGNNEYHELRALKAASAHYDPRAELLRRRMNKSYLYRQLRDLAAPGPDVLAPPQGVEWLPIGRMDVLVDEADRELGRILYREHLEAIVHLAQEAGVPMLLTTVATNLRDHMDNQTPGEAAPELENQLHAMAQKVDQTSPSVLAAEAEQLSTQLQTEGAQHRLGQILLRAGLKEAAYAAFEQSEALALRPMQSDKHLRALVHAVGAATDTPVCDLAAAMAAGARDGVPGRDEFIDHCHPSAAGHQRMGQALAACIAEHGLLEGATTDGVAAAILALQAQDADPFRLDHYIGHREIPGRGQPVLPDPGTALGASQRGHRAFVEGHYAKARRAYTDASQLGAPPGATSMNQALTALYLLDLPAARTAAKAALLALPADPDVAQLEATLR
jgi:lysophospholipase L1-like esterase